MRQLVGQACLGCGARVVMAPDAIACPSCDGPVHLGCQDRHECAPRAAPIVAAAEPPRRRSPWIWIGPIAGVACAAALQPVIQRWRDESALTERAAADLHCAAARIDLRVQGDSVDARGCDDHVAYRIMCRPLDRPDCLVATEMSGAEVDAIVRDRLNLPGP